MKINELEKKLNISRANIRFYEKEGLLNPERKDNGYREYDENEISILKKIIIYRKLGISIPNIKDIFNGTLTLGDAINNSMSSINSELTELAVSAKLCKDLKAKGVENSSLDEDFYWNEINKMENSGEEFYNFAGIDINAVEKRRSDTKYKVILYLTSGILFLFTIIVLFSQYGLVLAEYGNMVGVSELHHLPVIQAMTPVCLALTVVFVVASIIVHKNGVVNGKKYWMLFITGILTVAISIGVTICISYETAIFDEHYADITLSDEEAIKIDNEYKAYFPFYDDLYEFVGTEFHYTYTRCEIPNAVHIHIQNFSWYENDVFYDAEYFETEEISLIYQYSLQKGVPVVYSETPQVYPEGIAKTIDGIDYLIYQYENYYEIRIVDETSYFSIVLSNFEEMITVSETEFTDLAMQQYELVRNSAKNTKGESRSLLEDFAIDDIFFYLVVAGETEVTIILISFTLLFIMCTVFALICRKNKKVQLKLLSISYLILYEVLSFVLPLFLVWWLAAILTVVLILIGREYYEKQSIIMHFKQIGEDSDYKSHINQLSVIFSMAFISYMCGLLVFLEINL